MPLLYCRQRNTEIAALRATLSERDSKLQDSRSELAELHTQIKDSEDGLQQAYNQLAESSRDRARNAAAAATESGRADRGKTLCHVRHSD